MANEEGPRSAARFLEGLADGSAAAQLSAALQRLGATLRAEAYNRDEEVKGELSLRLKFTAQPKGSVGVTYDIKIKEPPIRSAHGLMFLTEGGNFQLEDPRQPALPGILREVPRPGLRTAAGTASPAPAAAPVSEPTNED